MSHVASLALCRALYEVSGWRVDGYPYAGYCTQDDCAGRADGELIYGGWCESCSLAVIDIPAYGLGCLLRKLPTTISDFPLDGVHEDDWIFRLWEGSQWHCDYEPQNMGDPQHHDGEIYQKLQYSAKDPEDAVVKAAIELFKQGVLTREAV